MKFMKSIKKRREYLSRETKKDMKEERLRFIDDRTPRFSAPNSWRRKNG